MEPDFSGYATKAGLKCADGRTIMPGAFEHQDKVQVPLVWQHMHGDVNNVLGHAILEARGGDVYAHAFFNETPSGQRAKALVEHKDVDSLSIYANQLVEKAKQVFHGMIKEVSLVLSGANPGAKIDYVQLAHADGSYEAIEDEAVIYMNLPLTLVHSEAPVAEKPIEIPEPSAPASQVEEQPATVEAPAVEEEEDLAALTEDVEHAAVKVVVKPGADPGMVDDSAVDGQPEPDADDEDGLTVEEVYNSLTPEQKDVVNFMIGAALEAATSDAAQHSDINTQEGNIQMTNIFEKDKQAPAVERYVLSHDDMNIITKDAAALGSLKDAAEKFALAHGLDSVDQLFPEAQLVTTTPEFLARRTAWVAAVLDGTKHTPFSRIKSLAADITMDEARAKGYIKANMKREEFFKVSKRVTYPQTIYKKQKLDRDDIVDITDFDVVAWMKGEMRLMLDEEIARAVLFGDGRSIGDEDKIQEDHVRPIASDDDFYVTQVYVNVNDSGSTWDEVVDQLVLERKNYRGSGTPVLYTTDDALSRLLLIKDSLGRRIYPSVPELAAAIRVSDIIPVEAMDQEPDLIGIMVNLQDYTIGADKGGNISLFDFFDIDYNQYKYLIETRISGALTKPKSALAIRKVAGSAVLVVPTAPTVSSNVVTIPTDANVIYKNSVSGATLTQGSTVTLTTSAPELEVLATPAAGKYFADNTYDWTFEYEA